MLGLSSSQFDPSLPSPSISCCSSKAGFSPYQSTRLSNTMPPPLELGSGHETAGVSRCFGQRGGEFSVGGACTTGGDAGDRVFSPHIARHNARESRRFSPRPSRDWL